MKDEDYEESEMPTPCQKCGNWFDLLDGHGSKKWFPNTVICETCFSEEEEEIEKDEEIEDLKDSILDSKAEIREAIKRLRELGVDYNF